MVTAKTAFFHSKSMSRAHWVCLTPFGAAVGHHGAAGIGNERSYSSFFPFILFFPLYKVENLWENGEEGF